jgi:hypothetical protein
MSYHSFQSGSASHLVPCETLGNLPYKHVSYTANQKFLCQIFSTYRATDAVVAWTFIGNSALSIGKAWEQNRQNQWNFLPRKCALFHLLLGFLSSADLGLDDRRREQRQIKDTIAVVTANQPVPQLFFVLAPRLQPYL